MPIARRKTYQVQVDSTQLIKAAEYIYPPEKRFKKSINKKQKDKIDESFEFWERKRRVVVVAAVVTSISLRIKNDILHSGCSTVCIYCSGTYNIYHIIRCGFESRKARKASDLIDHTHWQAVPVGPGS